MRGAAVRQPSQRRAAIRKRAAETAPPMPAPPVRRRRPVSAAAGRPDESVIPDGGPADGLDQHSGDGGRRHERSFEAAA